MHTNGVDNEDFASQPLSSVLVDRLSTLGIVNPTDVQKETLPDALANKDIIVKAKTGTGKTLAFVLPILQKQLNGKSSSLEKASGLRALILCPTRELVDQVAEQLRSIAKAIPNYKVLQLTGGMPIGPQLASLKHVPEAIVATPGRLLDVLSKSKLSLDNLQTMVIDEADRIMDMGFADQMQRVFDIINASVSDPQYMLFSATLPASVQHLVSPLFRQPQVIEVQSQVQHDLIEQVAWQLTDDNKRYYSVAALLTEYQPQSCIVFCNKKREVDELYQYLLSNKFDVIALHGDMQQSERDNALRKFKTACANVMVASDVAARGLDIDTVELVISAHVSVDIDTHIHRIGRTGRANKKGIALVLYEAMQQNHIERLADATQQKIPSKKSQALRFHANRIRQALFKGLIISAGKKQKINKVDIVGVLTKQAMLPPDDLGKIIVSAQSTFIAVKLRSVKPALKCFRGNKIKGKRVSVKAT